MCVGVSVCVCPRPNVLTPADSHSNRGGAGGTWWRKMKIICRSFPPSLPGLFFFSSSSTPVSF